MGEPRYLPCSLSGTTAEQRATICALVPVLPRYWTAKVGWGEGGKTRHGITLRPEYGDGRRIDLRFGRQVQAFGPDECRRDGFAPRPLPAAPERRGRGWRGKLVGDVRDAIAHIEGHWPLFSVGWRPMSKAPLDTRWVMLKLRNGAVVRAHWAEDHTGEYQPPFRGWFTEAPGGGFREVDFKPVAWRPDEMAALQSGNPEGDAP